VETRTSEHTLSIGATWVRGQQDARTYLKAEPPRATFPPPMQRDGVFHARKKADSTEENTTTATTDAYIWWCSGDRLDGSIVPKETMFCMSRSSTCSSIRGEWKGKLRLCFAYMSVI
jgi:hypothetical protein